MADDKQYLMTHYKVDGTKSQWFSRTMPSLETLQQIVEGNIELLWTSMSKGGQEGDNDIYGNEEALLLGMPLNKCFRTREWYGPLVRVKKVNKL